MNYPKYQMSIPVLKQFIDFTKRSGYRFDFLVISGGEPLLWDNLAVGVQLIRDADITSNLTIFSNGIALERFDPITFNAIYNNVDHIRITNLGFDSKYFYKLKEWLVNHKKFYFIDYSEFIVFPDEPVADSLPADCGCAHYSYSKHGLNICTLSKDLYFRYPDVKVPPKFPIDLPLSLNYIDKLAPWRLFDYEICQYCISNNKVRSKLKRVPNKPVLGEVNKID